MKFLSWSKKGVRWVIFTLLVLLATWVFHPPIAKWAIAKYGSEALGRAVSVSHFRFNPFNASARLGGLRIAEAEGDSAFLEIASLYANVDLMRTLGGHFELESLIVHEMEVRVVQDGGHFNFSDIIERFTTNTEPEETEEDKGPTKFTLLDMHLEQARISYQSHLLEWPVRVDELNVSCPRVVWNEPIVAVDLDLRMKNNATIAADIELNKDDQRYAMHVQADEGRLRMFEPYVSPYMQHGGIGGTMRLDLFLSGSGQDPMAFAMKGKLQVDSMRFRDPQQVELAAFERFELLVDTIDVKHELYRVRRATIQRPYALVELYDDGDNYSKWLVSDSAATDAAVVQELGYDPENPFSMLAHYVKMVAENYATMNYRVDSIGVVDGRIRFNDYTLEEPFRYEVTDLVIRADDINSSASELVVKASSTLNTDGRLEAELAMDPHSSKNLRIDYTLTDVVMPSFAPYTVHYVAHPLLSGRTQYTSHTTIENDQLDSRHELFIEDMQFGKKLDIQDAYDLPMRLVVSLLRDKDGNIDLNIPISGDLSDPNYHLWPVIWQVVRNIFIKALSAPANMLARAFDADEDDLKAVRFLPLQEDLTNKQTKPLDLLLRVKREKPELSIELVQCGDKRSEAENYALDQAKARYYMDSTGTALDSNKVDESLRAIDIRSPGFVTWLDAQLGPGSGPVQERCMALVGREAADAEVARLWEGRRNVVEAYLREQEEGAEAAILVRDRNETDTLSMVGMPTFHVIYGADGPVATSIE